MEQLEPFGLQNREKLQLLNLGPRTSIEVHLAVEEIDERLSKDQIQQIVDIFAAAGAPEYLFPESASDHSGEEMATDEGVAAEVSAWNNDGQNHSGVEGDVGLRTGAAVEVEQIEDTID